MDGTRFDAWTRRRFGLAASGALAAVIGLIGIDVAEAGKHKHHHKKKKRCRKLGRACTHGGRKKCCRGLTCDTVGLDGTSQKRCCHTEDQECSGETDCCSPFVCGPDSTCILPSSDRALKANFGSVDPADMLQRVRDLPISTWNYTADNPSVRHIGPMAQDFTAAFGVGADDRHIHPIDGQGVALAAIQGLIVELDRLRAENAALAARVDALEPSLD